MEKQPAKLPGVHKAEVNYVAGSATVVYDETATDLKTIKARVHECGYHCAGESLPRHVCAPEDPPVMVAAIPAVHAGHAPEHTSHAGLAHGAHAEAMAHEMGHGAGMDMHAMARDMRNRFLIAAAFTVPVFVYFPMGGMFTPPAPPFGLPLNLWLFLLASSAVIYPVWPFVVAAWRALKNGVLNMAVLVVMGDAGPRLGAADGDTAHGALFRSMHRLCCACHRSQTGQGLHGAGVVTFKEGPHAAQSDRQGGSPCKRKAFCWLFLSWAAF